MEAEEMTSEVSKNVVVGAKYIAFHLKGGIPSLPLFEKTFEDALFDKYSFDTGFTMGTGVRDWQLDLLTPRRRDMATIDIQAGIEKRKWKVLRNGDAAEVYTDL